MKTPKLWPQRTTNGTHQSPELPKITPPEANKVKQVVGIFLYYACVLDLKILMVLNSIAAENADRVQDILRNKSSE